MPGIQYPRVPGHEVVGVVDAVGQMSLDGSPVTASVLGGMEAIADTVIPVVEGTFLPAKPLHWYPVFLLTVVTRTT